MPQILEDQMMRLGSRIRAEREQRGWSLADLAEISRVSRAMISRIERGESSPTATLLGRLSGAFQLSLSVLLARAEKTEGVPSRAADKPTWTDPDTGYRRVQIAGSGSFPVDVTEVILPAAQRVSMPAAAFTFIKQVVWVVDGTLTFTEGDQTHRLSPGDSFELGEPQNCVFANDTRWNCRYVVIISRTH